MPTITEKPTGFLAQVRIMRNGVSVFSKSKTFPTRALAKSWGERLEDEVRARGPGSVLAAQISVSDLILKHLKYQQKLRPLGRSTVHNHETVAAAFEKVKVDALTPKHLTDYVMRRRAEGAAPATIMANLSPISAAFHAAAYAHDIKVDPSVVDVAIKRLKDAGAIGKSLEVRRVASAAEEEALLAEFERSSRHHQAAIDMVLCFKLSIALPRRASELTRLRWADLDRDRKTILIRDVKHPTRKVGNHQLVPLLGPAWELVKSAPVLGEFILPYNTGSMCAAFERARARIAETGMPDIKSLRFHDLRRTGATRLLKMGLPIPEVCIITGHSSWQQLKRYCALSPEDVHESYDGLAAKA